jgi:hypothetical protein
MADEDQTWLEALAGRDSPDAMAAGAAEAKALRELIRVQLLEDSVAVSEVDAAREAQLVARARSEGLLPAQPAFASSGSQTPNKSRRRVWLLTGSALVACAMIASVALNLLRNPPPSETFRGIDDGTARIESGNPPALKTQLLRELNAAGVHATGYARLGRLGIDADLPQPLTPAVQAVLRRHHLPIPKDGVLSVEIEPAGVR